MGQCEVGEDDLGLEGFEFLEELCFVVDLAQLEVEGGFFQLVFDQLHIDRGVFEEKYAQGLVHRGSFEAIVSMDWVGFLLLHGVHHHFGLIMIIYQKLWWFGMLFCSLPFSLCLDGPGPVEVLFFSCGGLAGGMLRLGPAGVVSGCVFCVKVRLGEAVRHQRPMSGVGEQKKDETNCFVLFLCSSGDRIRTCDLRVMRTIYNFRCLALQVCGLDFLFTLTFCVRVPAVKSLHLPQLRLGSGLPLLEASPNLTGFAA